VWLHRPGEPLHVWVVLQLRGGSPQLHPNTISQAVCFVTACEGLLEIPANWDLWVHLFHAELHTLTTGKARTRRVVCAGSLTLVLRDMRNELYLSCTMTSNNADWEKGWFYLRNDGAGLQPYTGKVLIAKTDT
jgi:hypothetical protein